MLQNKLAWRLTGSVRRKKGEKEKMCGDCTVRGRLTIYTSHTFLLELLHYEGSRRI
jgi:hypothetical protein